MLVPLWRPAEHSTAELGVVGLDLLAIDLDRERGRDVLGLGALGQRLAGVGSGADVRVFLGVARRVVALGVRVDRLRGTRGGLGGGGLGGGTIVRPSIGGTIIAGAR